MESSGQNASNRGSAVLTAAEGSTKQDKEVTQGPSSIIGDLDDRSCHAVIGKEPLRMD